MWGFVIFWGRDVSFSVDAKIVDMLTVVFFFREFVIIWEKLLVVYGSIHNPDKTERNCIFFLYVWIFLTVLGLFLYCFLCFFNWFLGVLFCMPLVRCLCFSCTSIALLALFLCNCFFIKIKSIIASTFFLLFLFSVASSCHLLLVPCCSLMLLLGW